MESKSEKSNIAITILEKGAIISYLGCTNNIFTQSFFIRVSFNFFITRLRIQRERKRETERVREKERDTERERI